MSAICGVIGSFASDPDAPRALAAMLDAMAVRGPARPETLNDPQRELLLGVRTWGAPEEASSPGVVTVGNGALVMVADAEIFNYEELAGFLRGRADAPPIPAFKSHRASAELLAHLYAAEGVAGFRRVDGQFALALWDRTQNKLILARDHLGVRPLYFHVVPGRGALFSSEIRGLLQHPRVPAHHDEVAVSHYLTFLTVPTPRTLFAGISKLTPGTAAIVGTDGSVVTRRYWDLLDDPIAERDDERFYVDRVRELHDKALRSRLVDGPMGSMLSGGNDSSANAALMARHLNGPLHTFTVGLAELEGQPAYTDLHYARKVAEHIKSQHHERLIGTDEFLATIPLTIDTLDDMVSEPSSIFLHHALSMAKDAGIRTVITGEANDEISCGHGEMINIRHKYYQRWSQFMRLPGLVRKAAALAAPYVDGKRSDVLSRAAAGDEYFWSYEIGWWESEKREILTPRALELVRNDSAGNVVRRDAARLRASAHGSRDYLAHIVYLMMQDYYFGNLMLGKLDLLASHLGLDARTPYTAPDYAHFVFNIPASIKAKNDTVKYFFKRAIEGLLPDEIIYRPKQGFRTPVVELFAGKLGDFAKPRLLEEGLTRAGVLRGEELSRLLAEHRAGARDNSNKLWTVMVLNMWYERWVRGGKGAPAVKAAPAVGSSATATAFA